MTSTATYATRLQEILRTEGRTQAWLAKATGIDDSRLSYIVRGIPSRDAERKAIAEALGRTVSDVFPEAA